jgi:hypothetical protein
LEQKDLNIRQQKWVSKIQACDFDIEFVKGKNNVVADALSRRLTSYALLEFSVEWKLHLLVEYFKNKFVCELMDGQNQDERLQILDDLIYYKGRIYVVKKSKFKERVLRTVHDSPLVEHQGFLKTYRQIRGRFAWKGLKEDAMHYVRECTTCQQNKVEHTHPAGLLQPLPILAYKWESISMDFITDLPKVQGKDGIFVIVDRLTKFAHFFAISIV